MKKNILNILIIVLTIGLVIEIYSISHNKNNNNILEQVETKDIFTNKNKTLSIMVQGDNGEYTEDTSRTLWPDSKLYEYYGSECTDSYGSIIPSEEVVTFENNKIHIKTNNTIYCTLYFGSLKLSPLLRTLNKTTRPTYLKEAIENDELLRYVGTQEDVNEHRLNNYICFGTNDKSTCTSDKKTYMYRIMGITTENVNKDLGLEANQLKIIKAYPNDELTGMGWNGSNTEVTWETATIQTYLNSTFLGTIAGKLGIQEWKNLITQSKWYMEQNVDRTWTSSDATITKSLTDGLYKIGLMYASDYYNGCDGKMNTNCWMFMKNGITESKNLTGTRERDWTMSLHGYENEYYWAWRVHEGGTLHLDWVHWGGCVVRPVFFLTPNITLFGEGTEDNPFIISV